MYYPYLRGKKEELLAIKSLLERDKLSEKIIPIVEPVSLTSTLVSTLQLFCEKERIIFVIQNPNVGTFEDDLEAAELREDYVDDEEKRKVELAHGYKVRYENIIKSKFIKYIACVGTKYGNKDISDDKEWGIVFDDEGSVIEYSNENQKKISTYFVPTTDYRDTFSSQLVLIADKFNKKATNNEYISCPTEFFSKDHLNYKKHGYNGFSDYSIIGKDYVEGGFLPYTIVLHIVHFNNNKYLQIDHFTSDSNKDYKNQAGKFAEAAKKLYDWSNVQKEMSTVGLSELLNYYLKKTFPGLGMIKRLTLMHHLEIVGRYMDNN